MSADFERLPVETRFGFRWGPLLVERCMSGPRIGWVITVYAKTEYTQVRVSATGRNMSAVVKPYTPPTTTEGKEG